MTVTPAFVVTPGRRTAWMTARARNAAKRGWLIAAVGLLAVAGTLFVLIMVPREVDRALRDRINALPPMADTAALLAQVDTARIRQQTADSSLRALRTADADVIARVARATPNATDSASIAADAGSDIDARRELGIRVTRARTAPLVESYRAVGESDLLRNDQRARALLDSLNDVNRDREAYAALGGADARYAALTARLNTLGQRLLTVAEQRLAAASGVVAPRPAPVAAPPAVTARTDSIGPVSDTTTLAPRVRFNVDSVADKSAQLEFDNATARLVATTQSLTNARQFNNDVMARADAARSEFTVRIPPVAMLFAALVLGVALGYGVALIAEVRKPRVADVAEAERITGARVIVRGAVSLGGPSRRKGRAGDESIPAVFDEDSDSYQLLHVALTGFGDIARGVRVAAESPELAATVGINLAAAATRESRTALLVDGDTQAKLVATLLHASNNTGVADLLAAPDTTEAAISARIVHVNIGRGQQFNALMAGEKRHHADPPSEQQLTELQSVFRMQDLVVLVSSSDVSDMNSLLPASDVVLCAQVGQTTLGWLTRAVKQLRRDGTRLRAVLMWTYVR